MKTRRTNKDCQSGMPCGAPPPAPTKRRYRLSPTGLASLQAAALSKRPWEQSTGPKTKEGKRRSSSNALRHGERSVPCSEMRRAIRAALRSL